MQVDEQQSSRRRPPAGHALLLSATVGALGGALSADAAAHPQIHQGGMSE